MVSSIGLDKEKPGNEALIEAARLARQNACAPFSHFAVGAALATEDGQIIAGCNIENATLGLSMCAERVALFKAISEGHRHFSRIAIVADSEQPTPPCGACRQLLWEFGGDMEVISRNLKGKESTFQLKQLLPHAFDRSYL